MPRRPWTRLSWCGPLMLLAVLLLLPSCAGYNEFVGAAPPSSPGQPPAHTAPIYWDRAMAYKAAGDFPRAALELEQAIKADPDMYHAYFEAGLVYKQLGRLDRARRAWEMGLARARSGPDRTDYPRQRSIANMQAALAGLQAQEAPAAVATRPLAPRPAPKPVPAPTGKWAVLYSSNLQAANSQRDRSKLVAMGYQVTLRTAQVKGRTWHRVWVGCCTSKSQAQNLAASMRGRGLKNQLTVMMPGR